MKRLFIFLLATGFFHAPATVFGQHKNSNNYQSGSCPSKGVYYVTCEQPARYKGSLAGYFQNLIKGWSHSFKGPALIEVSIDRTGKPCDVFVTGKNPDDPNEELREAVAKMTWSPARVNGKEVYFFLRFSLTATDSSVQFTYLDENSFPVSLQVNTNQLNIAKTTVEKNAVWKNWNFSNSTIPSDQSLNVTMDKAGIIWYCTSFGIVRIPDQDGKWDVFSRINVPELATADSTEKFTSMAIANDNSVWVSTMTYVARFDGSVWTRFDSANSPFTGVRHICIDSSGVIWFCTLRGLIRMEGTSFSRITTLNSGLASNDVRSVYEDAENTLWIATAKGLNKVQNGIWTLIDSKNSKMPSSATHFVTGDSHGNVWVAGGIDSKYFLMKLEPGDKAIVFPSVPAYRMTFDPVSEKVWIATEDRGIVSFDGKKAKGFNTTNSPIPNNRVTDILIDKKGGKWLSTFHGLIYTTVD